MKELEALEQVRNIKFWTVLALCNFHPLFAFSPCYFPEKEEGDNYGKPFLKSSFAWQNFTKLFSDISCNDIRYGIKFWAKKKFLKIKKKRGPTFGGSHILTRREVWHFVDDFLERFFDVSKRPYLRAETKLELKLKLLSGRAGQKAAGGTADARRAARRSRRSTACRSRKVGQNRLFLFYLKSNPPNFCFISDSPPKKTKNWSQTNLKELFLVRPSYSHLKYPALQKMRKENFWAQIWNLNTF